MYIIVKINIDLSYVALSIRMIHIILYSEIFLTIVVIVIIHRVIFEHTFLCIIYSYAMNTVPIRILHCRMIHQGCSLLTFLPSYSLLTPQLFKT